MSKYGFIYEGGKMSSYYVLLLVFLMNLYRTRSLYKDFNFILIVAEMCCYDVN